jgi:hypothetical protein
MAQAAISRPVPRHQAQSPPSRFSRRAAILILSPSLLLSAWSCKAWCRPGDLGACGAWEGATQLEDGAWHCGIYVAEEAGREDHVKDAASTGGQVISRSQAFHAHQRSQQGCTQTVVCALCRAGARNDTRVSAAMPFHLPKVLTAGEGWPYGGQPYCSCTSSVVDLSLLAVGSRAQPAGKHSGQRLGSWHMVRC